ncbi:MAG: SAM-dependent DNA methyltransferase [Methanobacterium sp.]|nr:SAM-dependent DNA methyltransferase [Methanobacterium sp.]
MTPNSLVNKVWNFAHVLRDDGVGYGDYVEQITCLLFLKMDQEQVDNLDGLSGIPEEWRWEKLARLEGDKLETQYRKTLEALSKENGLLGTIFRKAQNKIQDPAKLSRIVSMIDEETWLGLNVDVKGAIYEGLLERNATEVKGGAGQYFTPRPLIQAIVEVMRPKPGMTVHDPACGTGGFLLTAYEFMKRQARDKTSIRKLKQGSVSGVDIVDGVVRLCAMNLYLHGVGGEESPVRQGDALLQPPSDRYSMILTNPPFGKKSSYTVVGVDGELERETQTYERDDFLATTSNKQINFLQHIMSALDTEGSAAVVLPDNILFEGGAGEKVRRKLLTAFDFHTMIRLPTGIFYKPGVKANVLFFDKKPASETPWTHKLWIYDFRTNLHFTLKQNQLKRADLDDFVASYRPGDIANREPTERFESFTYDELIARDKVNLDIFWLKDESLDDADGLGSPAELATQIIENLAAALEQFRAVAAELGADDLDAA